MENQRIINGKKYVLFALTLAFLNLALVGTLIRNSFAQAQISQTQVKINVIPQNDSPLAVSVTNIDTSMPVFQVLNCKLKNVGNKPIKGYVLSGTGQKIKRDVTVAFSIGVFKPGEENSVELPLERQELADEDTIALSIDYVAFADGTFWGPNQAGKAIELAGNREGVRVAVMRLKNLANNRTPNNTRELGTLMGTEMKALQVDVPNVDQPDQWKRGFVTGFKGVIAYLKKHDNGGGVESLKQNLSEIEKNVF